MKPGDLVRYELFPDEVYFGYVMYLDTDYANDVFYRIRWTDGTESEEYERELHNSVIKVIQ